MSVPAPRARPPRMTSAQLIREIRRHQPGELTLLLGAGASKSSGVPLASEMIEEWGRDLFDSHADDGARARKLSPKDWLAENRDAYPWVGTDAEYSRLFEAVYHSATRRQKYMEEKIDGVRPGWGYLYLANVMVHARRFTTVFTTNFDDLINEALSSFLRHNAIVCSADSEVDQISFLSDRAKIIKLHGDYLFIDIRNTEDELRLLGAKMAAKFSELSRQRGLVVLGYAGRDQSVMSMIETLLDDPRAFPHSVYWGLCPGEEPSERVKKLVERARQRFELFECADFDGFMADLHAALGLELPPTILTPHTTMESELQALVAKLPPQPHSLVREHCARLQAQLGRPVEAELAMSQRDYRSASALAQAHLASHGPSAAALTVLAGALAVQAEEEGRDDLYREAIKRLEEAVQLNRTELTPRYHLAQLLTTRQRTSEAIRACEELRDLVPNDRGVRRNLISLYASTSRFADAERELGWLVEHEPGSADVEAMRGTLLAQRGLIPQAVAALRAASRLTPDVAWLHNQLGQMLATIKQVDEAESELRRAAEIAPDNLLFLLSLADFHLQLRQRPDRALPVLERAVALNPRSAEARGKLGEVYLFVGRPEDAERETAAAAELSPEDPRIIGMLGTIRLSLDREAEAEESLRRSIALNAELPQPHHWLALISASRADVRGFNAELQEIGRLAPQFAQPLQYQANALRAQRAQMEAMGRRFSWRPLFEQNQPPAGVPAGSGQWTPQGATPGAPPAQQIGEALRSLWDRLTR